MGTVFSNDNPTIVGFLPLKSVHTLISNAYDDLDNFAVVDFANYHEELGIAWVSDTTGHRYESPIQQDKKAEIQVFWNNFHTELVKFLTEDIKLPIPFFNLRYEIHQFLQKYCSIMEGIGKTSTFSCAILVQLLDNRKALVTVQTGDSISFKVSGVPNNNDDLSVVAIDESNEAAIAGRFCSTTYRLIPLDEHVKFIMMTTDGVTDSLSMSRHSTTKELCLHLKNILTEASALKKSNYDLQTVCDFVNDYSISLAKFKLQKEIIREAELDDMAILAFTFE